MNTNPMTEYSLQINLWTKIILINLNLNSETKHKLKIFCILKINLRILGNFCNITFIFTASGFKMIKNNPGESVCKKLKCSYFKLACLCVYEGCSNSY